MKRVLLTSVPRPLGPQHGDAPSVGYELLHRQVTRAQGLFSPRSLHIHFALEYIAENLDSPCVTLQYPSRTELIRELKRGYDYIGISFLLAVFHRMKEVVALVRQYSPKTRIVLGGYGTVLSDEELLPYADHICREEGVAFFRQLLGEPAIAMPYRHPLILSRLKVLSTPVSQTGMIFAGLGCPNGCDFCCTSHFFKRKHIRLLPQGKDIHAVVERYLELDPNLSLVVLDEDFLLNRRRAMEFRDCVLAAGKPLSLFVFASVKALSQYQVEEIVEMGIDGLWIGYEGQRSGYSKQVGRPVEELFADLRAHGITILASMIVGLPYQDLSTIECERADLFRLKPTLCQFLIYGPTPGTPFFERVRAEGLLRDDLAQEKDRYYRACDGFAAMVKHPHLSTEQLELAQRRSFEADMQELGPSIYRSLDTWFLGWQTLKDSQNPMLRLKAARLAREIRKAYPVFMVGRLLGPNAEVRRRIRSLERSAHAALGRPNLGQRVRSLLAVGMALWTAFCLRFELFQHPQLTRRVYRLPDAVTRPARVWRQLAERGAGILVERRTNQTVWVRLEGKLEFREAAFVARGLVRGLRRTRDRVVLDMERLSALERKAAAQLATSLQAHRSRVRILPPSSPARAAAMTAFALFGLYHGSS